MTTAELTSDRTAERTLAPLVVDEHEAARLLSVCYRTIRILADRGEFPRVRIGPRAVRYRVADLQAYVDALAEKGMIRQGAASQDQEQ